MSDTATRINAALADLFGLDAGTLHPGAKLLEDLGLDSLDSVELAMALEAEFHVEIPDDDWDDAPGMTLAQVAALVDRRLAAGRAA